MAEVSSNLAIEQEEEGRIERDTEEGEDLDVVKVMETIAPSALLSTVSSFGMHYRQGVFSGWVRQPSPCCGAASLAGAFNALLGLHRNDYKALTHISVLTVYRTMFTALLEKKILSFSRKLGAPFETILTQLELYIEKEGKWIGGKKSVNPSKEVIKKAVYFLLNDETVTDEAWVQLRGLHRQELSGRDDDEGGMDGDEEEEVAGKEKEGVMRFSMGGKDDSFRSFYRLETSTADSMGAKSEGISKEPEEEEEDDEEEERPGKGKGKWDWMNDILKILKTLSGLRKLSDEKLPSTAPIGNQGILEGSRLLSEACGFGASGITASLFMGIKRGVKSTLTIAISLSDNKKTISLQWDCLRSAFADPSSVLLFHLKNHYALIFAIREYTSSSSSSSSPSSSSPSDESSPITIREVLTARRGQRPTVWISYEEMREICFSWEGYKVIRLSRSPSSSS